MPGALGLAARSRGNVPAMTAVRALIRTSHPLPSLAITAMIMALVVHAAPHGIGPWAAAPAVLAGELSIGWSNDVCDAERDAAAGRTDKPLATGELSRSVVLGAALAALAASVVLGFVISRPTGVVNAVMMAAGWSYNYGLKSTAWSGLAYATGFGLIPAFAASTVPGQPAPRWSAVAAAALLGLGGHFANVLPDLAGDEATGVRGLPQLVAARFGATAVRVVALALLLGASALIAASGTAWQLWLGFAMACALALVGLRASGRTPFLAAMGIAAIGAASFVFGGVRLT
jgi:4-hydroxybenzoate polyprenyltransferase